MPALLSQLFSPAGLVNLSGRIEITDSSAFGYGGLADIWRGHYREQPQHVIAVKILRTYVQDPDYVQERNKKLIREGKVWSRLSHKHVVPFFGISFDVGRGQRGAPALICPYYANGNLTEYLIANPKANAIKLLSETASAVLYLHTLRPNAIVHGDIKASNILVDDGGHACLADFGLSRIMELRGFTTKNVGGSLRWTAYELVAPPETESEEEEAPPLTKATDVWAFGMTILEVLTGAVPYRHINFDPTVIFAIVQRTLPPRPPNFPDAMWLLLENCWSFEPAKRPSMREVKKSLDTSAPASHFSKNVASRAHN